jgi:hypothetical protein
MPRRKVTLLRNYDCPDGQYFGLPGRKAVLRSPYEVERKQSHKDSGPQLQEE